MVQRITIESSQYQNESKQNSKAWIALKADQIHYLTRVLRLKAGEQFIAQNGQGQQWLAVIGRSPEQAAVIAAIETTADTAPAPLRLIAALPKGNSFDQVVRQATELGVTHICPVITERTLLKPSDNKLARWRRIAAEASEQSERIVVPHIFEPSRFEVCIKHPPWEASANKDLEEDFKEDSKQAYPKKERNNTATTELRYLCAARSVANKNNLLLADLLAQQSIDFSSAIVPSVTLAIGPEGGWTSDEITVAVENSYKVVSLGSVILRAVTAPLTALSLVSAARDLLI